MADRRRLPVTVASSPLHTDHCSSLPAKGSRISVTVVEAVRDLIVVSFDYNSKVYQGALLDITNRSIKPFCASPFPKSEDSAEDEAAFALRMRHTYVASSRENEAPFNGGPAGQGSGKAMDAARDKRAPRGKIDQHVRMRKLRPRQTLCSNCQTRCDDSSMSLPQTTRGSAKKNTAPLISVARGTRESSRGAPHEGQASGGDLPQPPIPTQTSPSPWTEETAPQADMYASVAEDSRIKDELPSCAQIPEERPAGEVRPAPKRRLHESLHEDLTTSPMILRKRRSAPICALATPPEDRRTTRAEVKAQQQSQQQYHSTPQQSPVIKISFNNPQGKGTVVKIPAKVALADYEETTSDDEDKEDFTRGPLTDPDSTALPVTVEEQQLTRAGRRRRDLAIATQASVGEDVAVEAPVKHHKHKAGKHKKKRRRSSAGAESGEDSAGESVPDFPPAAVAVEAKDSEEIPVAVEPLQEGDVVWGKVMGFPWWPGRIISLGVGQQTPSQNVASDRTELQDGEAHVAWFGSSTSSRILITSLAPFLRDFKLRYNRRKRGPYKEAIRQATQEAKARSKGD